MVRSHKRRSDINKQHGPAGTIDARAREVEFGDCGNGADKLNLPEAQRLGSHVPLAVRQQHDLAEHSAFAQHLVRAARLFERQPLRDQGLDLALFEQVQQR